MRRFYVMLPRPALRRSRFGARPRQRFAAVSPDGPDHFPVVFAKLQLMWREGQPTLSTGDLARVPVPVLVVVGDDDVIDHAHTVTMYEAIPGGQLAVILGASHAFLMEKPELLNRIVLDFLAEQGSPETMLPVRRAARGLYGRPRGPGSA